MKPAAKQKRLERKQADHKAMLARGSKEGKVSQRMETGGYHKPGSVNKR